jgi:uncharacterized membrane protein YgaE (UPF0421/DUF939 family)
MFPSEARARLRWHLWPALQTAAAAVAAWYLASLVVPDPQPSFASIAAVIAIGATYSERPARARELMLGVLVGLSAAEVLVRTIGTGPLQVGGTVLLAMSAALLLGSGLLLVSEAGVSAILLTTLAPSGVPLFPSRPLEALIGVGVALAVSSLAFPPNPRLHVARASNTVLVELGIALEGIAAALERRDPERGQAALAAARGIDAHVAALGDAVAFGRETARMAPAHRTAREPLGRYGGAAHHIDLAVRDTRILARHAARLLQTGAPVSPELPAAVRELKAGVWELAGELDGTERPSALREHAACATAKAGAALGPQPGVEPAAIVAQIRSIVADLLRASQLPEAEPATEELLAGLVPEPHARCA